MARQRNRRPLPPRVVEFFTDYAELLTLARRIAPLARRTRRHLAGMDPAARLHFSSDFSVAEFDRMLAGIDWAAERVAQELFSAAANPVTAVAGDFDPVPGEDPDRAFAHEAMRRAAMDDMGAGDPNG